MINLPPRGFELPEYESRLLKIQTLMHSSKIDVILLTTQEDIEYFTGFKTQFLQSPTRPWFVLIPLDNKPIAIIPTIGQGGMSATWLDNIQTWSSPNPLDEGVSLLTSQIKLLIKKFNCLGVAKGQESIVRMALNDYNKLINNLNGTEIKDCTPLLKYTRYIKSAAEVAKIKYTCELVSQGFEDLTSILQIGKSERTNCQTFKQHLLALGVDDSPYLISGSGFRGYDSIIMGPSERILQTEDILVIDTGCVYDSYFCDFDRNFAFEKADEKSKKAHRTLYKATTAGFKAAKIGNTTQDIYKAMYKVLQEGGNLGSTVGRLGHGLGLQLTEWPSNMATNPVKLEAGVVLTLEPSIKYDIDKEMVAEENILITEDKPVWLTRRANEELAVIY